MDATAGVVKHVLARYVAGVGEPSGSKRAKRLALGVMGALLVIAVPYGFAITTKYRYFSDYVAKTLDDPDHPPRWARETLSPIDCVDEAVAWGAGCPGEDVFCEGGFRRVVRECMQSQDRRAWCADNAADWASTRFGYHACEARIEAATTEAAKDAEDDYCPAAYRALAAHCKRLGLRPGAR